MADEALIVVNGLGGYLFFSKKQSTNSDYGSSQWINCSFSIS